MSHFSILTRQDAISGDIVFHTRFTIDADIVRTLVFRPYEKLFLSREGDGVVIGRQRTPYRGMWRLPTAGRGEVTLTFKGAPELGLPSAPYSKVLCHVDHAPDRVVMRIPSDLPEGNRRDIPSRFVATDEGAPFKAAMSAGTTAALQAKALDAFRAERQFHQLNVAAMCEYLVAAGMRLEAINPRLVRINGECQTLADLCDIYRRHRKFGNSADAILAV